MAIEVVESSGGLFVVWGQPRLLDVERAAAALQRVYYRHRVPVTYVTRVPADAPTPDGPVRRHIQSRLAELISLCSSCHVVLEGDGFVAALKRGVLLSLFQVSARRGTFFVHANCHEVAQHVTDDKLATVTQLLRRAQAQGLLGDVLPVTVIPPRQPQLRQTL